MKQIEHLLQTLPDLLLLARGACIETVSPNIACVNAMLLLARGACIETAYFSAISFLLSCSSQEEHVLKQGCAGRVVLRAGCSSQEEHVLKLAKID